MKCAYLLSALLLFGCKTDNNNNDIAESESILSQPTAGTNVSRKLAIFVPGGSYRSQPENCELNHNAQGLPEQLEAKGWDFLQLCYPVFPEARFPVPHQHLKAQLIDAIPDYDKVVVIGSSAGATVSFSALHDANWPVDAYIGIYGVYDIHSLPSPLREEVMAAYSDDPIIASPVNYPLPDNTAIHLVHSLDDEMVPYTQSLLLCDSCTTLIPNLSHGFPLSEQFSEISRILDKY